MVAPQQRKQVVVKSIGEIERESTVRARPMGSRTMGAVGAGIKAGQNIAGVMDNLNKVGGFVSTSFSGYNKFASSRPNWLAIGLMYGLPSTRRFAVPQGQYSMIANIPNYLFTAHDVYSGIKLGLDVVRGK